MADDLTTLTNIENAGNLNPAQATQLKQLRAGITPGAGSSTMAPRPTVGTLGGGSNPYGNPDISGTLANQRQGDSNLLGGQQAQNSDYLNRFKAAISGQEGLPAMANRIGGELGLPALRQNANYLNTQVQNMPYTQKALTTGFDVNQNQLNNLTNKRVADLTPALNSTNNALNSAQQSLDTQMGYNVAQQSKELQPYSVEQTQLADFQARQSTMYSQENQNELNSLLQQRQLGYQWDQAKEDRAQQLAMQEAQFEQAKQLAQQQNAFSASQNTQPDNRYLNGGQFYDTQSGRWITAPKTGTGGGNTAFDFGNDWG